MNRRDYIKTISTAATANLVLDDFIQTKPQNSEAEKYVFRRGVRGEIKIVIQKFESYDEPKLKIFDSRGKQIHSFVREEDTPFPHIGRFQVIMYKQHRELRETVFLSYFDSLGNRVRGMWVTGDKAMSQQGEGNK